MSSAIDRPPGNTKEVHGAHDGIGTIRARSFDSIESASFHVLELEFPPGSSEGVHHHLDDEIGLEHYLVTEGELVMVIDSHEYELTVGDAIAISQEKLRETRNDSSAIARTILVFERLRSDNSDM